MNATQMQADATAQTTQPVKVVAFDFDGTALDGNSPVILVKYLVKRHMLPPTVVARIVAWAAAYKLRLPQNEAWVRGLVFRAFSGMKVEEVDKFLRDFYDECCDARFRQQAEDAMNSWRAVGAKIAFVSATFEPIILQAMTKHPIDLQISTRMKKADDGTYTCEVEGEPVEGEQKMIELRRLCNGLWGPGGWELEAAYGDHHSDRSMLAAANQGFAVCPDRPLSRTAKECGYTVLEW